MPHYHLITGKLAADGLRRMLAPIDEEGADRFSVQVLPITVAALMTTEWIASHIGAVGAEVDEVILPGYCRGDVDCVATRVGKPVRKGPKDYRELPEFLGRQSHVFDGYGASSIEILAEINHAPELGVRQVLELAQQYCADGADVIDVGCLPGTTWSEVGDCVRALRGAGCRVSIDSWDVDEVEMAVQAGAELVLSVNSSNRQRARDWGCEVVVVPDEPHTGAGLDATIEYLSKNSVPFRVDPILEPIGCGFAASLGRYLECRRHYPALPMMMGIGNVTELTAADSAGLNLLLLGFCQEQSIHSVLTTQVIGWARSCVRECVVGRRMVHYAVEQGTIPKHLPDDLVLLRDARSWETTGEELEELARRVRDRNIRLALCDGNFHLVRRDVHLQSDDPFELMRQLLEQCPGEVDPAHAFYLGYELAKAVTARTLGKVYRQDDALRWGILTEEEPSHRGRETR